MNTVWIVTNTSYEDYDCRLLAVFSTKEKAEEYVSFLPGDLYIMEFPFDADLGIPKGMGKWRVRMQEDGSGAWAVNVAPESEVGECRWELLSLDWSKPSYELQFVVIARDHDHAIQIAQERRKEVEK